MVESCTTAYMLTARCIRGRHDCGGNTQYVYLDSEYDIIDKVRAGREHKFMTLK
jgi:hypothetical protein